VAGLPELPARTGSDCISRADKFTEVILALGAIGGVVPLDYQRNPDSCPQMKTKRFAPAAWIPLMWLVLAYSAHAQNLVTNPGFKAGNTGFTTDYIL
jgi:hypothetical protein